MLTLADVRRAREVLAPVLRPTPVLFSHTFTGAAGAEVHLKAECLQRTGSFKFRGAYHKVSTLPPGTRGVVCVSAGNHAQGVALAARLAGLAAVVVMPEEASLSKVERTRSYGAEVVLLGRTLEEAEEHALALGRERELTFLHPFDDPAVVAGQATLGLEIAEQIPEVSLVLLPVGGGGLAGGVALALKESLPRVRVVGVQAEGACAAFRSFHEGRPVDDPTPATLADGIRVGRVSELTLGLLRRYLDDLVTVSDEEIAAAMARVLDRSKLLVEGAGAAALSALEGGRVVGSGKVCAVLSGGNLDLTVLARVVERGLTRAGRYSAMRARIPDRPGALFRVLGPLARLKVNVLDIEHRRAGFEVPVGTVEILVLAETRDRAHRDQILAALRTEGIEAEVAALVPERPARPEGLAPPR